MVVSRSPHVVYRRAVGLPQGTGQVPVRLGVGAPRWRSEGSGGDRQASRPARAALTSLDVSESELSDPDALIPWIVERCLLAAAPLEFRTFLVAVRAGGDAKRLPEAQLLAWKGAIKRGVGLALALAWEDQGRTCDFERPELRLTYDQQRQRVERVVRPVWIYGRYRKLVRELPQTQARWRCPACRGAGCPPCEGTGRRYPTALEDLLGAPVARALDGRGYTLHGMGREDVDVRCLGTGRPFVLQVDSPRRRSCDLEELAATVGAESAGRAEVVGALRWTHEGLVARLKGWEAPKTYRAVCALDAPVSRERIADLAARLTGATLEQRTPARVARRRTDKVRRRRVLQFEVAPTGPADRFEVQIQAESGTYIKELISGDDGRTSPSVAGLLGVGALCASLDVLEVGCTDEELLDDCNQRS